MIEQPWGAMCSLAHFQAAVSSAGHAAPVSAAPSRRRSRRCVTRRLTAVWLLLAVLAPRSQPVSARGPPPHLAQPPPSAIFMVAELNYTAAAPGPADVVSTNIAIPPLTTDAAAAADWYLNLAQKDAAGRTIICYGVYRFYSDDIANIGVPIMQLLLAGLGGVLNAVQLSFHAAYAVLQQAASASSPAGAPEAADPPAADSAGNLTADLSKFNSMDLYFTMAVQKDARLRAPLNADLLDLTTAFLTAKLQSSGYGQVGALFLDLAFPAGFANAQQVFVKETFFSTLKVTGTSLLPFTTQKQNLVLAVLKKLFQMNGLPARTQAILPFVYINAREANASASVALAPTAAPAESLSPQQQPEPATSSSSSSSSPARRLLVHSAATANGTEELHIIVRCRMYPVQVVTVAQLWQSALANGAFAQQARQLGLNASAVFLNATVDTTDVPQQGITNVTISTYVEGSTDDGTQDLTLQPSPSVALTASSGDKHLGAGASIGIAVAGLTGVSILLAAALLLARHWRRRRKPTSSSDTGNATEGGKDLSRSSSADSPWPQHQNGFAPQTAAGANGHRSTVLTVMEAAAAIAAGNKARISGSGSSASFGNGLGSTNLSISSSSVSSMPRLSASQDIDIAELEVCHREDGTLWTLGRGSFGTVFKALRRGVQEVALKKIDRAGLDPSWLRMLHKEIAILSKVSFDRNIVQFYGSCLNDPAHPILVMEYMAGGDLRQALADDEVNAFAWDAMGRGVALDIARGLHFLHSSGVVHRDLKTSNVLLSAEGVAKIADVGLALVTNDPQSHADMTPGTWAYAAPELILGLRVTSKADMFSFGVVLWELVTKEPARRGMLREVEVPRECPREVADLIDDCLSATPEKRPCAAMAVRRLLATPPAGRSPSPLSRFASATC